MGAGVEIGVGVGELIVSEVDAVCSFVIDGYFDGVTYSEMN